jgi:hypothetical protein
MQTDTILDLLEQLRQLDLSPDKEKRMKKVIEHRASGAPYRTSPIEDYVRALEEDLARERARNTQLMDRVVELESVPDIGSVLTHDTTNHYMESHLRGAGDSFGVEILVTIGLVVGMLLSWAVL